MIPALIVAGIIFVVAILLEIVTIFKIRKKFCYTIQTHKITSLSSLLTEKKKIRWYLARLDGSMPRLQQQLTTIALL